MLGERIGNWLSWQRLRAAAWKKALFVVLGILVALNVFIHPHEPHFGLDAYPGFWAAFGCGFAVVMTVILKKIVFPILGKPEDYYDRDE
ncbi:hypothetical protein GGQ74_001322 [Desulfobaculum xiamenense]|uniref:2TM domain-containing protein n=1 Tax=Desulfobaculum xiamenense TaxID=995050 RepID=A0A846QMJ4_9BACT|nr:hypothetical protein [Desulfobaculum xiamenense]NJB67682.1 hypothetical protein [Desulfobaculum xiamenense]